MCTPPNYCSYCLTRMQKVAIRKGDGERANQLTTLIADRENAALRPAMPLKTINLDEVKGKIAFDLDDTVGSFEADMRQALAKRDGLSYEQALERYPSNPEKGIASWWKDDPDPDGRSYKEFEDLEKRHLLYHSQPVREGAGDFLNWINKRTDGRVEFLTARPEAFGKVSQEWLKHRVGIDFEPVVGHSNKKEDIEDYEVLVDDSVPHVKAVVHADAPHGPRKVVFMTRPRTHEAIPDSEHVHHAWSWSDVKKIFGYSEDAKGTPEPTDK